MKKGILLVVLLSYGMSYASPRTWTSADGRSIEGEYLGRAPDGSALVLKRSDTGMRVTVPVQALNEADRAFAATLPTALAPEAAPAPSSKPTKREPSPQLVQLASTFPAPRIPASVVDMYMRVDHPDVVDLQRRYQIDFRQITQGDIAMNVRTLRVKIGRDLERLRSEGNPSGPSSTEGQKRAAAARVGAYWLSSLVLPHIAKIEAENARTDPSLAQN